MTLDSTLATKIIVWIPRITGPLSMIGSSFIIFVILNDRSRKLLKPNNRILLVMSCVDVFSSLAHAFSTAPIPKERGVYGAIGNEATCNAQGFFLQLGFAVPYYNASLCVFFLLFIRYNIKAEYFGRKIEPFVHFWALLYPLGTAIVCLIMGWFDDAYHTCWIEINPCNADECRHKVLILQSLFSGIGLVSCFVVIVCSLLGILHFYVKIERAIIRYQFSGSRSEMQQGRRSTEEKKEAAKQALLFIVSFFVTYFSPILHAIYYANTGKNSVILGVTTSFFLPLQGFWNFIIYARPLINRIRKENPNIRIHEALRLMIFSSGMVTVSASPAERRTWRRSITSLGILNLRDDYGKRLSRRLSQRSSIFGSAEFNIDLETIEQRDAQGNTERGKNLSQEMIDYCDSSVDLSVDLSVPAIDEKEGANNFIL